MLRFDSELELESHELGRSLLFMIRDDDMGFNTLPTHSGIDAPTNPFDEIRERLAAVDSAILDLHPQVNVHACFTCEPTHTCAMKPNMAQTLS